MTRRRASPKFFQDVTQEHLAELDRLAERGASTPLRELYDNALRELEARSRGLLRGQWSDTFTAHHRRMVMAQLRQGVRLLTDRMAGQLVDHARVAAADGRSATARAIMRLEAHYTGHTPVLPVAEAARFVGAIPDGRPRSLLRDATRHGLLPGRVQTSMARYGGRLVDAFEQELSRSIIQGETVDDAVERIGERGALEWWQAERIARTESAYAFNAAHADYMEDVAAHELPDLHMRWSEHVDDATGAALDNRVAADSVALHGQVAPPGGEFTMPPSELVDAKWWGMKYEFPPNRPHDRASLLPVRPDWGVARCWTWTGAEKAPWPGR